MFWFVALALWVASALVVVRAWRDPAGGGRGLTYFLTVLWMWNAVAYHALLFTRINPAAWLFAALFAAQAMLLLRAAARAPIRYLSATGPLRLAGAGLVCYALAYPLINVALGHAYPATPTYGVPCPTDILTIGLLLTVRPRVPLALGVVPALWGIIGGSAALLLSVPADFVLLGAGILLLVVLTATRIQALGPKA
jgi:hypothetical protein